MKTLDDYILDAQRREARFLQLHKPSTIPAVTKGTAQTVVDVLQPNYTTKDGIPCHNNATKKYYENG